MSTNNESPQKARQILFNEGLRVSIIMNFFLIRQEVTGAEHVKRSWANVSDFSRPMQELATEAGWGLIWGREGLDRRTRSLINIAMLTAMGKSTELAVHVRGAFQNGCTEKEIQEALLQASVYAGLPSGLEGFRVAQKVVDEEKEKTNSREDVNAE
ncbi:putative Carboxymuconolactone decarboxylase-like domain-containing protein [Seiridium unicorne]|uniref:Carboxymuconolactone decarboxylase-like domain-containing protein n=1 Tax=Seiridium unicorne TaxID=138068 RepID=A0ABR2V9H3_9PEZI